MIITLVACYAASLVMMSVGFVLARRLRRVDAVDVFWGITIMSVAVTAVVLSPHLTLAAYVALLLVLVWGFRLSSHITRRFRRSQVQDERYTELMKSWPKGLQWVQVYGKIFVLQSVLALVVTLPIIVISESSQYSLLCLGLGVLVWVIGFVSESIGDSQLAAFIAEPKNRGKLMTSGLWRYSRHPNYFGEMTMWWGIWVIAIGMDWWWLGVVGPLTISILLRFVSGVPLAEKRAATKPEWAAYKRRTSVLFPLPPR